MSNRTAARKHRTPVQREQILRAYRRTSLVQREFAARAGIGLSTLQLWLRKAATGAAFGPKPRFVEVANPLARNGGTAPYRVYLTGGLEVEVRSGFPPQELTSLLRVLRSL
jgi:hypothetical protein